MSYARWSKDCKFYAYARDLINSQETHLQINDETYSVKEVKQLIDICNAFLKDYGERDEE